MSGRMTKQEGLPRQRLAKADIDADAGWRVQTADDMQCRNDQIQTLQLHAQRGMTAQGGSRVEEERDKTSRGSHNGDRIGSKCHEGMIGSRTLPDEVIPEKGN